MIADFGVKIMELETCMRSIFDSCKGTWMSTEGYMKVFEDEYGREYALTAERYNAVLCYGRKLFGNETATFLDEQVRAMTPYEESLWDQGILPDSNVDLWGNIRVENPAKEYEEALEKYYMFSSSFADYIMYNSSATESDFRAWKKLWKWINVEDNDVSDDNKVCFITWLEENWNGFFKTVIEREYKYMNISEMILNDWEKF